MKNSRITNCYIAILFVMAVSSFSAEIDINLPLNPDSKVYINDMLLVNIKSNIPISKIGCFCRSSNSIKWEKINTCDLSNEKGYYSILWLKGSGFVFSKLGVTNLRVVSYNKSGEMMKTEDLLLEVLNSKKLDFNKNHEILDAVSQTISTKDIIALSPHTQKALKSFKGNNTTFGKYVHLLILSLKLNTVLDKYIAKVMSQIQEANNNEYKLNHIMIEKLKKTAISSEIKEPLINLQKELMNYNNTFFFYKFLPNIIYAEAFSGSIEKAKKDYNKFYNIEKNLLAKTTLKELFVHKKTQTVLVNKKTTLMRLLLKLKDNVFNPNVKKKKKNQMFLNFIANFEKEKINEDIVAELTMMAIYLMHLNKSPVVLSSLCDILPINPSQADSEFEKGIIKFYRELKTPLCDELKKSQLQFKRSFYLNAYFLLISFISGNKNLGDHLFKFYKQESNKKENFFLLLHKYAPKYYNSTMEIFQKRFH